VDDWVAVGHHLRCQSEILLRINDTRGVGCDLIHGAASFTGMSKYSHLFSPLRVGALQLKHRVVMAPLTRMRVRRSRMSTSDWREAHMVTVNWIINAHKILITPIVLEQTSW